MADFAEEFEADFWFWDTGNVC